MRTFTRAQLDDANVAWTEGDFSREWRDVRHYAAMGGLIWPPNGSKHDSWEDDSPSQRAILIRAIRETPKLLRRCIVGAKSWDIVIERLLAQRDLWRDELDAKDRAALRVKDEERRDRTPMAPVRAVLQAWADSHGVDITDKAS